MPKIRNFKGWIDTGKLEHVNEHPDIARVQKFRNFWLKFRNEYINRKSARIEMPTVRNNTTEERLRRCLSRLSWKLAKERNRTAALNEIKNLTQSGGLWNEELHDLKLSGMYTANNLQQLRKNTKLLLKKDDTLPPETREFLKEVFLICDSELVLDKGCDHEKKLVEELLARESAEATPPRDAHPLVLRERKPALHRLADGEHADDAKSDSEDLDNARAVEAPPPLAEAPPPVAVEAPPPVAVEAPPPPTDAPPPLPPLNMSGPGASNGSTGETSASGISPADPEQKAKEPGTGHVRQLSTQVVGRQPRPRSPTRKPTTPKMGNSPRPKRRRLHV